MAYQCDMLVRAVQQMLMQAPARTLSSIASELHVSRHTISNAISAQDGVSFRNLQAECLKACATARLADVTTPHSIKEVAHLGYTAPRSFSRRLRYLTGQSPKALRDSLVKRRTPALAKR